MAGKPGPGLALPVRQRLAQGGAQGARSRATTGWRCSPSWATTRSVSGVMAARKRVIRSRAGQGRHRGRTAPSRDRPPSAPPACRPAAPEVGLRISDDGSKLPVASLAAVGVDQHLVHLGAQAGQHVFDQECREGTQPLSSPPCGWRDRPRDDAADEENGEEEGSWCSVARKGMPPGACRDLAPRRAREQPSAAPVKAPLAAGFVQAHKTGSANVI